MKAYSLCNNTLIGAGLREKIKVGASGKIISAFDIASTMAIGADWVNSARGFMFAVGVFKLKAVIPTNVLLVSQPRTKTAKKPFMYQLRQNVFLISIKIPCMAYLN